MKKTAFLLCFGRFFVFLYVLKYMMAIPCTVETGRKTDDYGSVLVAAHNWLLQVCSECVEGSAGLAAAVRVLEASQRGDAYVPLCGLHCRRKFNKVQVPASEKICACAATPPGW